MRNNPDDLSNQLIAKIKKDISSEISTYKSYSHEDDVDSRELGILDGRYEMAIQIKNLIKKWEKDNADK
jgi:hypothetical protein|tara:strand:+ start:231 stop:437 length:207 start_codon:yes stop_codon:yes gene_type:complete